MKDEITRLKFPKGSKYIYHDPLYVTWEENDPAEQLLITISDIDDTTAHKGAKAKPIRRFFFQVNSGDIAPLVFSPKDLILRTVPSPPVEPNRVREATL